MRVHLVKILDMRYVICAMLFCFLLNADAQDQGIIIYEDKVDIHARLPEDRQQYKDMIPQFRTTLFELHYTSDASLYVASKEEAEAAGGGDGRGRMWRMRMGGGASNRDLYKSLSEKKMVDSREFMDKKFLIKGSTDEITWKIGNEQKQILDYVCMQAIYKDTADTYVAWFTPQIPIANGPAEYSNLPGMILQIDQNDGERTLTAIEIQNTEVDKDLLDEPTKGKEVTSEEFREIMHEKMKEMRGQRGQNGTVIIRHN